MNFYIIRHPEPIAPQSTCYGNADIPLLDPTLPMAESLAISLPKDIVIYSSPLQRARLLCEKICQYLKKDFIIDARIQEYNFGEYELKPWSNIPEKIFKVWEENPFAFGAPAGETFQEFINRVDNFYKEIIPQNHPNIVLVAHSGILKATDYLFNQTPINQAMAVNYSFATMYKFTK